MSLRAPSIDMTSNGADPHICCRSASARSRWPATSDFAEYFRVQWTEDVLSHWMPAWSLDRLGILHSRTSHSSSTPAISRSLMVISCVAILATISGGKSTDQNTYRGVPLGPGNIQTPPAPRLQESQYPWQFGRVGTSCATLMGLFAISRNSQPKSAKIALRSLVRAIHPFFLHPFMAAQMAVNRPRPPGIPMDA